MSIDMVHNCRCCLYEAFAMALDEKAERISLAIIRDSLDGKAEPLMTVETAARHMQILFKILGV